MTMEPGDSWLEERLFDRRIVLCRAILDGALGGRTAAQLMALDALGDSSVELQLDSQGASLEAARTLIDVIDLLGVPVNIVCAGRVEGGAIGLLAAGTRRTALPHTRFRLTDPELEISGRANELSALLTTHRGSSGCTNASPCPAAVPVCEVAADFRAGRSLDAREAPRYRLVDEIAGDKPAVRPIGGTRRHLLYGKRSTTTEPLGFRPRPENP